MSKKPIRVLVVDADPKEEGAMPRRAHEVQGIEVVGVVNNKNAAIAQVEELRPDVLAVDLMLPGMRSIDLLRQVAGSQPQVTATAGPTIGPAPAIVT